jgi:hypothetical protein
LVGALAELVVRSKKTLGIWLDWCAVHGVVRF